MFSPIVVPLLAAPALSILTSRPAVAEPRVDSTRRRIASTSSTKPGCSPAVHTSGRTVSQ